jgi:endonuclease/exonuclease/phosphatase family metal-dependent hydrolase
MAVVARRNETGRTRGEEWAAVTVATINGEWMNDWLVTDSQELAWRDTFARDGVECDTAQAASHLAGLISEIDADVVALQEAPSRVEELELFVDTHLSNGAARYEVLLSDTGSSQKLALLSKPDVVHAELAPSTDIALLIEPWLADVDGDAVVEDYQFTRTPLVCRVSIDGALVEVIVAHLKSNFINRGEELWNDPARRLEFIMGALKNRRRIANEAMRIRQYLEARLAADPDAAIVVLGDFNDGPGQDLFEQQYLAHNVTDLLLGSPYRPETLFMHAQTDVPAEQRYTAVFDDFVTGEVDKHLLLDHIIVSPGMTTGAAPVRKRPDSGRIAHDAWANNRTGDGERRDERATDHRPATVHIDA